MVDVYLHDKILCDICGEKEPHQIVEIEAALSGDFGFQRTVAPKLQLCEYCKDKVLLYVAVSDIQENNGKKVNSWGIDLSSVEKETEIGFRRIRKIARESDFLEYQSESSKRRVKRTGRWNGLRDAVKRKVGGN